MRAWSAGSHGFKLAADGFLQTAVMPSLDLCTQPCHEISHVDEGTEAGRRSAGAPCGRSARAAATVGGAEASWLLGDGPAGLGASAVWELPAKESTPGESSGQRLAHCCKCTASENLTPKMLTSEAMSQRAIASTVAPCSRNRCCREGRFRPANFSRRRAGSGRRAWGGAIWERAAEAGRSAAFGWPTGRLRGTKHSSPRG